MREDRESTEEHPLRGGASEQRPEWQGTAVSPLQTKSFLGRRRSREKAQRPINFEDVRNSKEFIVAGLP